MIAPTHIAFGVNSKNMLHRPKPIGETLGQLFERVESASKQFPRSAVKIFSRRRRDEDAGLRTSSRRQKDSPSSRGRLYPIVALLLPVLLLVVYGISIAQSGWDVLYGYGAVFGPLSRSFLANFTLASLILCVFMLGYNAARSRANPTFVRLSFVVYVGSLLAAKYLLPFSFSNYYQSNFPDSLSHTSLGEWVALTGHIFAQPTSILTWQPGFWVGYAMFVQVIGGSPLNAFSPVFPFLIKWAPIGFSLMFLPIVYLLLRNYGVSSRMSMFGLVLFLGLYPIPVWMAEQTGGTILFWLFLTLLPNILTRSSARTWVTFAVVTAAMIFTHLGITIFCFTVLLSVFLLAMVRRNYHRFLSTVTTGIIVFTVIWFTRLLYNAGTFANGYLPLGLQLLTSFLSQPIRTTLSGAYRPYPLYQQVIYLKEASYVAIIIIPLALLTTLAIKNDNLRIRIASIAMAMTVFVLTPVLIGYGLAAGGALPYIPSLFAPFAALGFVKYIERDKGPPTRRHFVFGSGSKILALAAVTILAVTASYAYFAGANYLSYPYGENLGQHGNEGAYIECYAPIPNPCTTYAFGYQAGLVEGTPFTATQFYSSLFQQMPGRNVSLSQGYYHAYYTDSINDLYVQYGNLGLEQTKIASALEHTDVLYSTTTAQLLYYP